VTLERRRKRTSKDAEEHESDTEEARTASEAARRDASRRASELIARLRKL
jgi:hypothetical protein